MNMASTVFTGNQQEIRSKLGRLSLELFRTNIINEAEPSINSYSVITEVPIASQEQRIWRLMSTALCSAQVIWGFPSSG